MKRAHFRPTAANRGGEYAAGSTAAIALLCLFFVLESPAQPAGSGALLVLRTQAASIVEEGWHSLADSLTRPGDVWISVEGGSARRIVENALLDFLAQRGFRPLLSQQPQTGGERVQITVLDQVVQYKPLEHGDSQREIRTVIEMRRIGAAQNQVKYGGPYRRSVLDTVAVRDDGGLAELRNAEEHSFVDKLMGPVLLIGGAFLIVYLFFTVRN